MNPFKYNGPITKEDQTSSSTFVERVHNVNKILQLVQQGEYIQIIGPHQSGRTTLAIDLIDKYISEEDFVQYIPILISCESLADACREGFIRIIIMHLNRFFGLEEEYQEICSLLENSNSETLLDLNLLLSPL